MRRPSVYQRSAPRARRTVELKDTADYAPAARAAAATLPTLLREVEAVGAVTLARYLEQALSAAEGIVRRGQRPADGGPAVTS